MKSNFFYVVSILICNAVIANTNPQSRVRFGNEAFVPKKAELTLQSILQFELTEWFRNNKFGISLHWKLQQLTEFYIYNTCHIFNERQSTFSPNTIRFKPIKYVCNTKPLSILVREAGC